MSQAVVTLGTRAVQALALSSSVYDLTHNLKGRIERSRFWRHSLETAVASRLLATKSGKSNPDEAFVAGLLHDVGILVLESSFPEKFERIWPVVESGERLEDVEENIWGTNHARVAQFLFEQWHLPESICNAVGHHHNQFVSSMKDEEFHLPQIVGLADLLGQYTMVKARTMTTADLERREIMQSNLGLSNKDLEALQASVTSQMIEEARFLEMEIGTVEELLLEANRRLYEQYVTLEALLRENRRMQEELAQAQVRQAALDALKTITATFNHYLNNAAGTILGRAQLVQVDIQRGVIGDSEDSADQAMKVIVNCVTTIQSVLEELGRLRSFETIVYHDDTKILDIERKIKRQFEQLEKPTTV
ncbi:HDOD domain-containing protein [candidate division GN15 bacterium]|nr:HDOD domain-containing protein [candidate division GN15 bacterium]